jgi:predicted TIM-barrel fold metal-dependent hydrolase
VTAVETDFKSAEKIWANSGDSHFLEPEDLYYQILPKDIADRMPRSEKTDTEETVHIDGMILGPRPLPRMGSISGELRGEQFENLSLAEISHRPPGARDVRKRLADLDKEGIWGEVVYPSLGLWDYLIKDPDLAQTAFRAANEWKLSEVQNVAPDRLIVTASLPLQNLEKAVEELYHCAEIGYHAVFIPLAVPEGCKDWNYAEFWDPLWSAFEETGLIPAAHLGTEGALTANGGGGMVTYRGPGKVVLNYAETAYGPMRFATKMVVGGTFERHPKLKVLLAESGAGWVPSLGDRMNEGFRQHGWLNNTTFQEPPKDQLMRHFYCSFQHDVSAIAAMKEGYNNVLWGSDYPHLEGTFGHTQETLHELLDNEEPWVRERVLYGTFKELFPHVTDPPVVF